MPTGLSRSEFERLRRSGVPDEYPKPTQAVVQELQERGYAVDVTVLNYLVKTGRVHPSRIGQRNFSWLPDQIDAVAEVLEEQQSFQPAVVAARSFGFLYSAYLDALRQAVQQLRVESGDPAIAEDPALFVMHVYPPRFGKPARVSFSVCDDVRAHLCPAEPQPPFVESVRPMAKRRADESHPSPAALTAGGAASPAGQLRNGMAFSAQ